MNQPSVMKHTFSQVPEANIPRSVFDRTHAHKTMFDADKLIPFYVDEVLPGDTFNVRASLAVRMPSALNVPIMDNMFLDTFYFFVPNRLIWSNFKRFMGEQPTGPADSTSFTVPVFTAYAPAVESLSDYMGIPISGATTPLGAGGTISHVSLWHRAYNLIWNEWFRDQNLQNAVTVDLGDGPDAIANYVILKRGKRHDYFTSCLPWTQKGTAQNIPLGTQAPVKGIGKTTQTFNVGAATVYETGGTGGVSYGANDNQDIDPANANSAWRIKEDTANPGFPAIFADLTAASAATINSLRQAFMIQALYERDARGGTRYTEMVQSHFGVVSPDARLQRPEFLGGRSTPLSVTAVAQTSATNAQPTPAGDQSAYATALSLSEGFTKSFTEHGVIIALLCVRADLTYQQGLPKMFSRSTRLDFYFPALANLGEQAVLNKEIYAQGSANPTQDAAVFGYQERWAEYRYYPSKITGKLRSTTATPLDLWHLSEKFTALPTLSATFIQQNTPISRIIAVTTEPQFVMDSFIECKAVRPMPTFSIPGMTDHF